MFYGFKVSKLKLFQLLLFVLEKTHKIPRMRYKDDLRCFQKHHYLLISNCVLN